MSETEISPPDNSIKYFSNAVLFKTREGMNNKHLWSEEVLPPPKAIAYDLEDNKLLKNFVLDISGDTTIPGIGKHKCKSTLSWRAGDEDIIGFFEHNMLSDLQWEIKESFKNELNDLTADILDLCLLFLFRKGNGSNSIKVTADDFLSFRGIKNRVEKGRALSTYTSKSRDLIEQHLIFLTRLHLNIKNIPIKTKSGTTSYMNAGGPIINVGYIERIDIEKDSKGNEIVYEKFMWNISAGTALQELKFYLSPQYTFIDKNIFLLDHNKHKYPKRIGKYITSLFRINKSPEINPKVSTILEYIGIDIPKHNRPSRLKDKFEEWLNMLVDLDVIKEHTYDPEDPNTRKKDWVNTWLDTKVNFIASDKLSEFLNALSAHFSNKTSKKSQPQTTAIAAATSKLKELKKRCKISNTQICSKLNISRSYLSLVFSGKRLPSKNLVEKINSLNDNDFG